MEKKIMGYNTDYEGVLIFNKHISKKELTLIKKIIKDENLDLELTYDLSGIQWDGTEKTYDLDKQVDKLISKVRNEQNEHDEPLFFVLGSLKADGNTLKVYKDDVGHNTEPLPHPTRKGVSVEKANFIISLLKLIAKYEEFDALWWTEDLTFLINCNDWFYWATADAEEITPESLPELEKALQDSENHGISLYCCRRRKMRPQGAAYAFIEREDWHLFDSCGPERDPSEPCNTPKPE